MTQPNSFSYQKLFARRRGTAARRTARRGKYDFAVAYPDPACLTPARRSGLFATAGAQRRRAWSGRLWPYSGLPTAARMDRQQAGPRLLIHVSVDDIVLGDGSGQPIHMVIETLVDPGDVLITEDFVYSGTLQQMRRFRRYPRCCLRWGRNAAPRAGAGDPAGDQRRQTAQIYLHGAHAQSVSTSFFV